MICTNTSHGVPIRAVIPDQQVWSNFLADDWLTRRMSPLATFGAAHFQSPSPRFVAVFHSVARIASEFTRYPGQKCPPGANTVALGQRFTVLWYDGIWAGHYTE